MVMTKTATVNKNQALTTINDVLEAFQNWCNRPTPPSLTDLEKYFTKNFQITSNGKVVAKSLTDYAKRVVKFQKKYSRLEVTGPVEEPIFQDNRAVIHYEVELTNRNGQKSHVYIMALATLENNKISKWLQVANEKDLGTWDA